MDAIHPDSPNESPKAKVEQAAAAAESPIRVDVELLDKVMNLVGELVLARNQVLQFAASQHDSTLLSASQRLNLITTELQGGAPGWGGWGAVRAPLRASRRGGGA
jgi:two-component system chemotaxis sensor kinase CheA